MMSYQTIGMVVFCLFAGWFAAWKAGKSWDAVPLTPALSESQLFEYKFDSWFFAGLAFFSFLWSFSVIEVHLVYLLEHIPFVLDYLPTYLFDWAKYDPAYMAEWWKWILGLHVVNSTKGWPFNVYSVQSGNWHPPKFYPKDWWSDYQESFKKAYGYGKKLYSRLMKFPFGQKIVAVVIIVLVSLMSLILSFVITYTIIMFVRSEYEETQRSYIL